MLQRIFTLPTPDTVDFLQFHFAATGARINWDGLGVELGVVAGDAKLKENAVYQAVPGDLDMWYDSITARSWLILPLWASEKMVARSEELGNAWQRPFLPYMVLSDLVTNRHREKAILNSVATSFIDTSPVLTFRGEIAMPWDAPPPLPDFYLSARAKGGLSNQIFLEEDEGIE
jgi:hypothetical protein